jgi:hypothetical protein
VNSDFVKPIAQLLDLALRIPTLIAMRPLYSMFLACYNYNSVALKKKIGWLCSYYFSLEQWYVVAAFLGK